MTDLMRVRTVFNYGGGSPGLMTQYFASELGIYNDAVAQLAVDRVRDSMATNPTIWPPSFSWVISGDVDLLTDSTGVVINQFGVLPRTGAGTAGVGLGPLPVGILLKTSTAAYVSGRRLRGRTYFVPVSSANTSSANVSQPVMDAVKAIGEALSNNGLTAVRHFVWSRPRPATPVGPGRPAGAARLARPGSSAQATTYSCSPKYVVLTSRRD